MPKHVTSMLAIAAGLLAGSGGALKAQEKMTIGISYQNLAFPYVAALQKAAENACKALGVDCIEADAGNDTNKELSNVETMLSKGIKCLAFEAASLDASVASINAANTPAPTRSQVTPFHHPVGAAPSTRPSTRCECRRQTSFATADPIE